MQLVISKKQFAKIISVAQGVVPKRSTRPILMHVLLEASVESGLVVSATDEELSFSGVTEAQVQTPGSVAVLARDLYDIVRNFPDQPLQLIYHADTSQLELRCDKIEFRLQALQSDDFPEIAEINPDASFTFPTDDLLWLIDRTVYAVSTEETRYYLGGVYLEATDETLRAVATDGHRLALAESDKPEGFDLSPGQILPRKLLNEMRKMLDGLGGEITFGFQGKQVVLKHGPQTLSSLLVEGTFPDYRQVIPKAPSISCRVPRMELLDALRRVSLLSPDKTGGIRLKLDGMKLNLSSQHAGRGEAHQFVESREGGGDIEIGFNAHYFIDALRVIDTADVVLEFTNHLSPCLLRPFKEKSEDEDNPKHEKHVNVIMPMRL